MAQARKALLVRNVGVVAWLSGLVKNERETYKGNLIVENSACFVLKIELLLGVLPNFKMKSFLVLQSRYFDGQSVWLIFGITISDIWKNYNKFDWLVCVFVLLPLLCLYRGVRYRIWSSACKADETDFTDRISFLSSNLMEDISSNTETSTQIPKVFYQ